jgi:hypothetical protein
MARVRLVTTAPSPSVPSPNVSPSGGPSARFTTHLTTAPAGSDESAGGALPRVDECL